MFRHVVCFRLRPEEKSRMDEVKQRLQSLSAIPVVRNIEVGVDCLETPRSYDVILIIDFDSMDDYKVYDAHELHQPVRQFMRGIMEASVAIDYDRG